MPLRAYMKILESENPSAWVPSGDLADSTTLGGGFPAAPGMEILAFDFQLRRDKMPADPAVAKAQTENDIRTISATEVAKLERRLNQAHTRVAPIIPPRPAPPGAAPAAVAGPATACFLDPLSVIRP